MTAVLSEVAAGTRWTERPRRVGLCHLYRTPAQLDRRGRSSGDRRATSCRSPSSSLSHSRGCSALARGPSRELCAAVAHMEEVAMPLAKLPAQASSHRSVQSVLLDVHDGRSP